MPAPRPCWRTMSRPPRPPARAAAAPPGPARRAPQRVDHPLDPGRGQIAARPGRPGLVVAAPHGSSDVRTAEIAAEVARRTGFGLVVASGFELEIERREGP